jgi:uncharacterized protein
MDDSRAANAGQQGRSEQAFASLPWNEKCKNSTGQLADSGGNGPGRIGRQVHAYNIYMEVPRTKQGPHSASPWRRRAVRYFVFVAIVFLSSNLMLLALENWLLFHPVRAEANWDPPPSERVQDLELHLPDGTPIHGWWYPTIDWKPEDGATLYLHGNAGNLSHRGGEADHWQREMKQAILMVDYPGYGQSGGSPSEAGCIGAADAAYMWLTEERGVPGRKVFLYGGSLGGAVAVDLASRHEHRALILINTFASISEMAGYLFPYFPASYFVHNRFDSLSKIGKCAMPIFQVHRTEDFVVPFEQGKRLYDAAVSPKCFITHQGKEHDEALSDGLYERLRQFLRESEAQADSGLSVIGAH